MRESSFSKKEKSKKDNEKLPSLFILESDRSQEDKIRMVGLFGDIDEQKGADITHALIALKELGKVEIFEDPDDYESPVKEVQYKPIDFYIGTHGGDALEMFAIYDIMRMVRVDCEINTYGIGKVMSAGVLLLASGTKGKRKIGKNCRVMLHSVTGGQYGAIHNVENEMEEMRWIQEQHINALVAETDITKRHLKKMLDRKVNVYLNSQEAVEYGIADEII